MAEDTLVKEPLTDAMIEAGAELTRKLDEAGLPITVALWLFDPEINEWRLRFSSPEETTVGPLPIYRQIHNALGEMGEKAAAIPFMGIGLLSPNSELVRQLKNGLQAQPGIGRMRFTKNVVDGHYIDDALIYRVA